MATVVYAPKSEAFGGFDQLVVELATAPGVARVCEVGGGANPSIGLDVVERHGIDYTVLDIAAEQLALAPPGYRTLLADIAGREPPPVADQDLVFSRMLAEHVRDAERFHRNVHAMLRPGGHAVHLFPTLYSPPFVVNRLLPEALAARVLSFVQGGRDAHGRHAKFPAYYRWCRGPTDRQLRRFESLGYDVVSYRGYFGTGYLRRLGPLGTAEKWVSRKLLDHPTPTFTSYACVILRRSAA